LLCLLLTACASQQIKHTTIPEIIINYECQIEQSDKDSLYNAIINSVSCNISEPVFIIITEYYKADPLSQFAGWPAKVTTIKGSIPYKGKTNNIKSSITTGGLLTLALRDIKDVEQAFAKAVWKKVPHKSHTKSSLFRFYG